MPLPDHLKATLVFRHAASQMECTVGLYYTISAGSLTDSNAVQLADALMAHVDGPLAACLPESVRFSNVRIRYTNSGTEIEGESSDLGTLGTEGGDSLPEHDAVVIRRKTGTTGRARRGRIFMPFVPESLAEETGILTTAGVTAYSAFATLLDQNFVSAGTGITLVNVQPSPSLGILTPVKYSEVVWNICTRRDRQVERRRVATRAA
jgi:hypothetical protein